MNITQPKVNQALTSSVSGGSISGGVSRIVLPRGSNEPLSNITSDFYFENFGPGNPFYGGESNPVVAAWTDVWTPTSGTSSASIGLQPKGGWEVGFQPANMDFTFNSGDDTGGSFPSVELRLLDTLGDLISFNFANFTGWNQDITFNTTPGWGEYDLGLLLIRSNVMTTNGLLVTNISIP
jgi:hypothetical protein